MASWATACPNIKLCCISDEQRENKEENCAGTIDDKYAVVPLLRATFQSRRKIRYGFKVDKSAIKGLKGPFLVLGNHTSWVDFLYFSNCVYPHPMNVVVTSNVFYMKFLGKLFTDFGAIPKKQFTSDFSCIKHIKRNLDNGNSVLLFPEGALRWTAQQGISRRR